MKEIYYRNVDHFLNQKPFKPFAKNLNSNSLSQILSIILKFDKKFLINTKKEMVMNLLKYNVDGDWVDRIERSLVYKRASCSIQACVVRYGETVGKKIYYDTVDKVKCKRENYTSDEWVELCNKKRSNLGKDGYIMKYGKEEGNRRWKSYISKWRIGIQKRKNLGWKSGSTLEEIQNKHGTELGFKIWRSRIDKRKESLSLNGYIKKYGEEMGSKKWKLYCKSNNKTSYKSFVNRYGSQVGKMKYEQMKEKISKYLNNSPFYSKISQELFSILLSNIEEKDRDDVKYALHNGEQYFFINENFCKGMSVDFKVGNVIIEFYGDFWHANPKKYKRYSLLNYPRESKIAGDVWLNDKKKIEWLINKGYHVMVVWESDFIENKEQVINRCIEFIKKYYERS